MPDPTLPFLKYLQAIDPLFVNITKPLNDNIGEETCVGLKCIRNPNIWIKRYERLAFSRNPLNISL